MSESIGDKIAAWVYPDIHQYSKAMVLAYKIDKILSCFNWKCEK